VPYRKTVLVKDEIYHIFNRGIAKMPIYSTSSDFIRFLDLIAYYRFANTPISFSHMKKLPREIRDEIINALQTEGNIHVEILAFCLMDNHFHFLIKQRTENGIAKFISNIQNGYAKYYNFKKERSGPLFQPMFKSVRIETDEQLLHVSRYIHLNPSTGYLVFEKDLHNYPWFSLGCYIENNIQYGFVSTEIISGLMKNKNSYREFVFDQIAYQRELAKIKHLIME